MFVTLRTPYPHRNLIFITCDRIIRFLKKSAFDVLVVINFFSMVGNKNHYCLFTFKQSDNAVQDSVVIKSRVVIMHDDLLFIITQPSVNIFIFSKPSFIFRVSLFIFKMLSDEMDYVKSIWF